MLVSTTENDWLSALLDLSSTSAVTSIIGIHYSYQQSPWSQQDRAFVIAVEARHARSRSKIDTIQTMRQEQRYFRSRMVSASMQIGHVKNLCGKS